MDHPRYYPMTRLGIIRAGLLAVALNACGVDSGDSANILARVGRAELRRDHLISPANALPSEQAERWINEQVLRRHSAGSTLISRHSSKARSDELVLRLQSQVYLDSLVRARLIVSAEEIEAYYVDRAADFRLDSPAAEVVHIGFTRESLALAARDSLRKVASGSDSLLMAFNVDRQFVRSGKLLPVIERVVFSARLGRLAGPVESNLGYHLILVESRYAAGELIPLRLVRQNIYSRILARRWPAVEAAVLDSLRGVTKIEIFDN